VVTHLEWLNKGIPLCTIYFALPAKRIFYQYHRRCQVSNWSCYLCSR